MVFSMNMTLKQAEIPCTRLHLGILYDDACPGLSSRLNDSLNDVGLPISHLSEVLQSQPELIPSSCGAEFEARSVTATQPPTLPAGTMGEGQSGVDDVGGVRKMTRTAVKEGGDRKSRGESGVVRRKVSRHLAHFYEKES